MRLVLGDPLSGGVIAVLVACVMQVQMLAAGMPGASSTAPSSAILGLCTQSGFADAPANAPVDRPVGHGCCIGLCKAACGGAALAADQTAPTLTRSAAAIGPALGPESAVSTTTGWRPGARAPPHRA